MSHQTPTLEVCAVLSATLACKSGPDTSEMLLGQTQPLVGAGQPLWEYRRLWYITFNPFPPRDDTTSDLDLLV